VRDLIARTSYGSRLALLGGDGNCIMMGDWHLGPDGCYYSNTSYKRLQTTDYTWFLGRAGAQRGADDDDSDDDDAGVEATCELCGADITAAHSLSRRLDGALCRDCTEQIRDVYET